MSWALASMLACATAPVGEARRAEHVYLDGRLLRPGLYEVAAEEDGARALAAIDVRCHVRRSSFRVIDWGRAEGEARLPLGKDSLGYNLFYGGYGEIDR
ncbi:MAG: hypothetical protein ACUVYA_13530 [Planctomycetota bacterium]